MLNPRTLYFSLCSAFLIVALCLTGCSDKALQTTAKASADIAAANSALANTLISAQQAGTLTADQIRPILQVNLQIAQADQQVNTAIAGISALTPAQKTQILAILQPVVAAVAGAVTQTNLIPNATIKTSILASLTAIQAALATVQAVIG
jgi:hypothetical protein